MAGMVLLTGAILLGGCLPADEPPPTAEEMIERGRYLVTVAGCNDCHTPKVFSGGGMGLDESRLLSGSASTRWARESGFSSTST